MPRSTFGFGGRAQVITDYDPDASLRIQGRDLFYAKVQSGSSTAAAGFGGTDTYYATVSPKEIADRLENIEEIFQWYAIRSLRVFYAPATGSTSTVQIALGYLTDFTITDDITSPTQTQVLEMSPAALFPAWQPAMIEVVHRGTKLFASEGGDDSDTTTNNKYQGVLACTIMNGVESTVYGQLWVEYVVDFYQPCPILGSVNYRTLPGKPTVGAKAFTKTVKLRGAFHRCPPPEEKKGDPFPPILRASGLPSGSSDGDGWVDPSPPKFLPAPSSVPGTPGYTPRVSIPAKRAV